MEKNNLSPKDSLKIIDKAISNYKMNYKEHAKTFLNWGWVLAFASFSNFFILMVLRNKEAYNLMGLYSLGNWALFALIGFIEYFGVNSTTQSGIMCTMHSGVKCTTFLVCI